ncbi:MAG: hypothetical protein IMZ62_15970 [Chloroflexi bacterium]|nr:hypothetical protein [Chloroflexota bacterium]
MKPSRLLPITLLALMSMPFGPGLAPDIEIPDTRGETMKYLERDRQQRAKFPSRKKRMKTRKP